MIQQNYPKSKRVTICADDFAYSQSISASIVDLITQGRINATSCMTNMPCWKEDAQLLKPLFCKADIGLHFNLTEGEALCVNPFDIHNKSFSSLAKVMADTLLHRISRHTIEAELNAQLDAFIEMTGCMPDFIDGHQHIHQLPVVRDALINVYRQRFSGHLCYIRVVSPLISATRQLLSKQRLKEFVIKVTGSWRMQTITKKRGIPCNSSFAGVYDFAHADKFELLMDSWLSAAKDGTLIMCHPGFGDTEEDPISRSRLIEYEFLQSDSFLQMCKKYHVIISQDKKTKISENSLEKRVNKS